MKVRPVTKPRTVMVAHKRMIMINRVALGVTEVTKDQEDMIILQMEIIILEVMTMIMTKERVIGLEETETTRMMIDVTKILRRSHKYTLLTLIERPDFQISEENSQDMVRSKM